MRLLAVDDGHGGNKLVYPFNLANDAARQKAIAAIKRAMPGQPASAWRRTVDAPPPRPAGQVASKIHMNKTNINTKQFLWFGFGLALGV